MTTFSGTLLICTTQYRMSFSVHSQIARNQPNSQDKMRNTKLSSVVTVYKSTFRHNWTRRQVASLWTVLKMLFPTTERWKLFIKKTDKPHWQIVTKITGFHRWTRLPWTMPNFMEILENITAVKLWIRLVPYTIQMCLKIVTLLVQLNQLSLNLTKSKLQVKICSTQLQKEWMQNSKMYTLRNYRCGMFG